MIVLTWNGTNYAVKKLYNYKPNQNLNSFHFKFVFKGFAMKSLVGIHKTSYELFKHVFTVERGCHIMVEVRLYRLAFCK